MNLTQKEKSLLNDQLGHEKVCIQKYQNYASQASDQQLKQLFQNYAQQEQQHYNTISQILSGQVTGMSQGQAGQSQQSAMQNQAQQSSMQNQSSPAGQAKSASNHDSSICTDMLMTEKFVSGAYDTAIFEVSNSNVRQTLNHIQKEEQQHGEGIFNYMQSNGMYNIKD